MASVVGLQIRRRRFIIVAVLVASSLMVGPPASALEVPPLTGRIVDTAHLLPPDLTTSLTAELAAHEQHTGNQVALLTVPSLEGEPLEDFSHRVATAWHLGRKGTDNGVLILVAPADRKVRIEVGYGLEGTLTDAKSARIIRQEMVPRFRSGDYAGGIAAGLRAVLGTIEGTYVPPEPVRRPSGSVTSSAWAIVIVAVFVGILTAAIIGVRRNGGVIGGLLSFFMALSAGWLLALAAAVFVILVATALLSLPGGGGWRSSGGWSGANFGDVFGGWSSGGGGGFSGGGGDFGGGGASGSW